MEKTAVDEDARGCCESDAEAGGVRSMTESEGALESCVVLGDRERSFAVTSIEAGGGTVCAEEPQDVGGADIDDAGGEKDDLRIVSVCDLQATISSTAARRRTRLSSDARRACATGDTTRERPRSTTRGAGDGLRRRPRGGGGTIAGRRRERAKGTVRDEF